MGGQLQTGGTLRNDLRELVEEISFDELNLQAEKILPSLGVVERAASYPVLPRESKMKIPDTSRSPNGTYSRGQWEWGTSSYTTEEYGHEEAVDLTQALENKNYLDEEEVSAQLAKEGLLLARESRVATALFNETAFAGTAITNPDNSIFTGATDCLLTVKDAMDTADAAPYAVFDLAWKVLRGKNGLAKDQYSAIMSDDLVDFILRTNEVMSSVLYVEPVVRMSRERKKQFLAEYLGLKEIVSVSSIFDTSGLSQSANIAKFWSNEYCLLAKLSDGRKTFRERCIGRQVVWTKYSPNYIIEDYPEPQKNSRVIRAREYRGIVINTDYGILLSNMKDKVDATTGI
jgi:hypothetical protein